MDAASPEEDVGDPQIDDDVETHLYLTDYRSLPPRVWDLRRLVADDTPGVIDALGRLRNTRYHDRPVSLYGGMVELRRAVRMARSRIRPAGYKCPDR